MEDYWIKIFESDLYINEMLKIWEEGEKWAKWIDEVVKKYKIDARNILDVPCGIGRVSYYLTKLNYNVSGIDISEKMINTAKERVKKGNFIKGDMRHLSTLIRDKFDIILNIFNSLGYYEEEDDLRILNEFRAVLKQGGLLIVNLENRDYAIYNKPEVVHSYVPPYVIIDKNDFDPFSSRLKVTRSYLKDGKEIERITFSQRLYSLHEIVRLLTKSGFEILEVLSGYSWKRFEVTDPQMAIIAKPI
ncbi:class I SAM-dependent methyltransferase [Sulfolobus acidocaldarius]|uniref:Conserved protein n=4 Tax=Sulfolobus acidocaldarius TaxID=2285 RepID=Q4J6D3_SULAC|nr:class I SAM-dependent methyltransferase [Sulfolobus acidocaldarius]AAY81649.1 conserved protein [Sulfolobus acidocaldarius DSM 639]AGE72252.1 hypothetical protein SacN8_11540 [Sulfolobus acidocaldarius N8]AGE74569.1 hypothetical protein SacRon12I_11785 [Sulfolobus acidocaldarius Ron12/I]ALU29586.1 SAM-dependent methyltransferase [Sulfolobus acidocaldarius]ALU32317.1 SAM-dependent methyltransferase [Sulfolobus acidocaldarius]